jgi:2-polyprenyl-6-hydroxyphenyl methylase/3-demethylubiquinone-9 3-methyltransferase
MPVDNEVYDRDADNWRNANHFLSMLVPLARPRAEYVHRVLAANVDRRPSSIDLLDLGCGGGLLAEHMAKYGYRVTGVDPSARSVAAADRHAKEAGLAITYQAGRGESLPYETSTFDAAYSLDVLEHVDDVARVIAEVRRVLKPGGVFVFDTINRTLVSKLAAIKIMQEWRLTRVLPTDFHDWHKFIKPRELKHMLQANGFRAGEFAGLTFAANPLRYVSLLRRRRRGSATYLEIGEYLADHLRIGRNMSVSYAGYAVNSV